MPVTRPTPSIRALLAILSALWLGIAPAHAADSVPLSTIIDHVFRTGERPPPRRDPLLDRAAAALASGPLDGDPRAQARAAGVSDGAFIPLVIGAGAHDDDLKWHLSERVLPHGITDFGMAEVEGRSALIFVRRVLSLEEPLTILRSGTLARALGRLAPGYSAPQIVVARPDGRIDAQVVAVHEHRMSALIPLAGGDGRYTIEVLAQGPRGLEVVLLTDLHLGDRLPNLRTVRLAPADPGSAPPEEILLTLINRDRRALGIIALKSDPALTGTAQSHAAAMARAHMAAHLLPGGEPPAQRLARAGVVTLRFYENVALARSPDRAHAELMASPSHRRALLDPMLTHIGLAAAQGRGNLLYIVEHLAVR